MFAILHDRAKVSPAIPPPTIKTGSVGLLTV